MNTQKKFLLLFSFLLISSQLAACTFPTTETGDIDVYFGRPRDGDVIMLGESFDLLANGSFSAGRVTRVLFFANGAMAAESPNRSDTGIVATYNWTPDSAGQYVLQIAAQRGSETAYSPTITVCVLPFQIAPGHPTDIYAHGYEGDCTIPARSSAAVSGSPVTDTVSVSPESLTYVPTIYYDACPDQERFLNFKFYIDDPRYDVVIAADALSMSPALMGRISGETTLALTHIGNRPPHTKLFVGSIDMHIFLERSLSDLETGEGLSGNLSWTARAFGRDGSIIIEEGPFTIPVTPVSCEGTPQSQAETDPATATPVVQVSPTPVSNLPTTFTLTSNAICRAGPGLDYKIAEYINNGDAVKVQARSEDAIWLVVLLPNGVRCWVSSQLGSPDGDPNLLPVETAPIISLPTATNTNDDGNEVEEESGGTACVEPSSCGQNQIYDGCNCIPVPKP